MYKYIIVAVFLILGIGLSACGSSEKDISSSSQTDLAESSGYKFIPPEEAKNRIDNGEKIILLDVRTKEEYTEKHIPDSILIPVDVIEQEAPSKLTDKNATIFVYCRSGRRSAIAADTLAKMGYTKVFNLGGINNWTYETESGE